MNTFLTDSMARDHAASLEASAAASRRARDARRDVRRAERALRRDLRGHARTATVGHAAARPFAAARQWLVAGQL